MSVFSSNWVWTLHALQVDKMILLALADHADEFNESFPSIATIARRCCVSERTVQRTLKKLEEGGWILTKEQFTLAGRQTSSRYKLNIDNSHLKKIEAKNKGDRLLSFP